MKAFPQKGTLCLCWGCRHSLQCHLRNPGWAVHGKSSCLIWIYAASPYMIYFLHSRCLLISSIHCYQFVLVNIQNWLFISLQRLLNVKSTLWCDLHAHYGLRPTYLSNFKFYYFLSPDHTLVPVRMNSYFFTPFYMLLILPFSLPLETFNCQDSAWATLSPVQVKCAFCKCSCALTCASLLHITYLALFCFWLHVLLAWDWKLFIYVSQLLTC